MHAARKIFVETYLKAIPFFPICGIFQNVIFLSSRRRKGSVKKYFRLRRGGESLKSEQNRTGGGGASICVHSLFFKKNAEIFKIKFIVILLFFLLIIIAVWNIKQTMKDYNFSPVNEWHIITFAIPHKITNVGYVNKIYFLRRTFFGTPNENFAFETLCKLDIGTKKLFS